MRIPFLPLMPGEAGRGAFAKMGQIVSREVAHVPEAPLEGNGLHRRFARTGSDKCMADGVESSNLDELAGAAIGDLLKSRLQRALAHPRNLAKSFDSQVVAEVGFNVVANRPHAAPVIARGEPGGSGSAVGGQRGAECCEQRVLCVAVEGIVVKHQVRIGRLSKGGQGSSAHPVHR